MTKVRTGQGARMTLDHPFLLPEHLNYGEVLTDAAVHVLSTRGVDKFSVSAMARHMRVTPEAVLNEYSRSRVLEMVTTCFARRWLAWSLGEYRWIGPPICPLRLPRTTEERHGFRVLRALEELAEGARVSGNPLLAQHLTRLREDETAALRSRLAQVHPALIVERLPPVALGALVALVRGLRETLVDDPARLTFDQACAILDRSVRDVASPDPGEPTTPPDQHRPHEPAA